MANAYIANKSSHPNPNRREAVWHDDGPECVVCGAAFNPARAALGYDTCLQHGEAKREFTAVPVPKSGYIIATNREQLLNPYSHKGTR